MNYETLTLTQDEVIWTLTINRPASLNALNAQVLSELSEALDFMAQKPYSEARVLVVTGAGEKAFVAGADIKSMTQMSESEAETFGKNGQNVFRKLERIKIPVIAAVNGFALGGGLELALACDFIYASEKAQFGLPEVSLGLIPGFGGTVRLSKVLGPSAAKEWIYTGKIVKAEEALKLGLVNYIFSASDLMTEVKKTAQLIASRGPVAIAAAKQSIQKSQDLEIDEAMAFEANAFKKLFASFDMKEGTQAFVEKRKAQFEGR